MCYTLHECANGGKYHQVCTATYYMKCIYLHAQLMDRSCNASQLYCPCDEADCRCTTKSLAFIFIFKLTTVVGQKQSHLQYTYNQLLYTYICSQSSHSLFLFTHQTYIRFRESEYCCSGSAQFIKCLHS